MNHLILKCAGISVLLAATVLAGCVGRSSSPAVIPEVGGQIGDGYGYITITKPKQQGVLRHATYNKQPAPATASEIEGQLNDGGWIMNIPGEAHTHKVVLTECPEQPVVVTHVHNDMQAAQLGKGPHKHKGCYICPPKNSLVKRVLGQ